MQTLGVIIKRAYKYSAIFTLLCATQINLADDKRSPVFSVVATESPPYLYTENKQLKGPSFNIIKAVFIAAKIPFEIKTKPWARVYKEGLTINNVMIASLGRTSRRETLFHWIGPLKKSIKINFYALKNNKFEKNKLEGFKNYLIGVERSSYTHDFLIDNQFPQPKIHLLNETKQLIRMLTRKRVDYILISESQFIAEVRALKLPFDNFEKSLSAFEVSEYLAVSKKTNEVQVKKLQAAYKKLISNKEIKILGKL